MAEPSGEVLRLLENHQWEDTLPRLLRHASIKMRRLRWLGERNGTPPRGLEPDDIVQIAFEKLWSGVRGWDPAEQPDLLKHLMSVVDSEVSNLVNLAENRRTKREDPLNPPEHEDSPGFDGLNSRTATPEQILLDGEAQKRGDDFVQALWVSLDGEPELQEVVEAIIDDVVSPAKIAARLGVEPDEIYRRKKLLRRRLSDYRKGPMNGQTKGVNGNVRR